MAIDEPNFYLGHLEPKNEIYQNDCTQYLVLISFLFCANYHLMLDTLCRHQIWFLFYSYWLRHSHVQFYQACHFLQPASSKELLYLIFVNNPNDWPHLANLPHVLKIFLTYLKIGLLNQAFYHLKRPHY